MSRFLLDSLEFSPSYLRESVHDGFEHQSLHIQFLKYFVLRNNKKTKQKKQTNFVLLFFSSRILCLLVFLSWHLIPGLEKEKGWMHACQPFQRAFERESRREFEHGPPSQLSAPLQFTLPEHRFVENVHIHVRCRPMKTKRDQVMRI